MNPPEPHPSHIRSAAWDDPAVVFASAVHAIQDALAVPTHGAVAAQDYHAVPQPPPRDAFYILLPLLIVLSTFLFLLLLFLICVIILRRRRGIMLRDHEGPVDMSREDLVEGEGGFDGVESRWLESTSEPERRMYLRAKRTFPVPSSPSR